LGVIYFLATASLAQRAQVHRIILFDPGSTADFTGSSCHPRYDINTLLADWLQLDPTNNRLVVLTGQTSEMRTGDGSGRPTYSGLWHYYFSGIWHRNLGSQVQVCDYYKLSHDKKMDHEDVLHFNYGIIENPQPGCPGAPPGVTLTPWNP